jgi:mono/diheme cytochrome c family protein
VPRSGRFRWGRVLLWTALGALALFVAIQFVPYGRDHSNPPVTGEPNWDSAETRALAARACFDCHSNETTWPWYSKLAPVSWLVQADVDGGRETLNFSEWNRPQEAEPGEIEEVIRGGSMPPWYYTLQHSNAKLSGTEKDALISGLDATIAASPPGG